MNNSENSASPPNTGPGVDEQELLNELMPKLGMEATVPKKKYKAQARTKYLLPRVLGLAALFAVGVLLGMYLMRPAQFHDVEIEQKPDGAEVRFTVDQVLLLESVTAELDGRPAAVTWEKVGSYEVTTDKNGELRILARTLTGRETVETITVDGIDEEPPHIAGDALLDGYMYIYFTDQGGAGIDWESVSAAYAETGEVLDDVEISEEASYVRFPFPDQSVRVTLKDKNDNPLAAMLNIIPAPAENEAPAESKAP